MPAIGGDPREVINLETGRNVRTQNRHIYEFCMTAQNDVGAGRLRINVNPDTLNPDSPSERRYQINDRGVCIHIQLVDGDKVSVQAAEAQPVTYTFRHISVGR